MRTGTFLIQQTLSLFAMLFPWKQESPALYQTLGIRDANGLLRRPVHDHLSLLQMPDRFFYRADKIIGRIVEHSNTSPGQFRWIFFRRLAFADGDVA